MTKTIILFALIYLFSSCGTGLKISKSKYKQIDNNFSGTFVNQPSESKGRNYDPTILKLFEIYNVKADSVYLKFNEDGKLLVIFHDSLHTRTEIFEGRFRKKGYYEIYLRKKRIYIPLIYSSVNVYRIRIASTIESNLVIDNLSQQNGNIFLLAGGFRDRTQFFFKPYYKTQ